MTQIEDNVSVALTDEGYNSYYKTYSAAYCRKTGLPMYDKKTFGEMLEAQLYSKSRAAKEKVTISDRAYGWYRVQNGFIPLFKKEGK